MVAVDTFAPKIKLHIRIQDLVSLLVDPTVTDAAKENIGMQLRPLLDDEVQNMEAKLFYTQQALRFQVAKQGLVDLKYDDIREKAEELVQLAVFPSSRLGEHSASEEDLALWKVVDDFTGGKEWKARQAARELAEEE
jgi:hypothetical protein